MNDRERYQYIALLRRDAARLKHPPPIRELYEDVAIPQLTDALGGGLWGLTWPVGTRQ